jgi:predicted acylesterase/phospholipase RssA
MQRDGLALSGGGFRAALCHLGVVGYLRDAGMMDSISHIASVSGGSVLAAHLVLNWDRYRGSSRDFEEAAQEILDFLRLDIRNRLLRRHPYTQIGGFAHRLMRSRMHHSYSRTGLLQAQYRELATPIRTGQAVPCSFPLAATHPDNN